MRLLLLFLFFTTAQSVFANSIPSGKIYPATASAGNAALQVFTEYQPELNAGYKPEKDSTDLERLKRKAKWAKWLGIGAVVGLFIPGINVLAIPAAIISLVLAGQVKKEAVDKRILKDADIGKKTSLAALLLVVIALIVVLVVVLAFVGAWR